MIDENKTGLQKLEESGITDAYECNNFIEIILIRCITKTLQGWITSF